MLETTPVSRCLDRKLKVGGLEIPDVLAIFLCLSILNFVFGQSEMKLFLVWLPPIVLTAILYFGKRGKPGNYLIHWIRFQVLPGRFCAFTSPTQRRQK